MKKTIYTDYLGMQGEGSTAKEAKEAACSKIEKALQYDYTPSIVCKAGTENFMIIFCTPHGYAYRNMPGGMVHSMFNDDTRESTIAQASYHLEQMTWNLESDDKFPLLDKYPQVQKDLKSWARWQRDYKRLKDLGHDDQYCHQNAQS